MSNKPTIIAYYLPQYYPFKENDEWWGKGFTEWTNVAKAKPLFRGHYQPKVPSEIGFYDLRLPEIAEQQAALAKEAGISAFCYWHYWFGNSKVLLDMPLRRAIETGKPDFPFCLGWANESWEAKVWNTNDSSKNKILIEQQYPGNEDVINHFKFISDALKDKRYFRINNRPIFVIYQPYLMPDVNLFMKTFNSLIKKSNIADSFYFIAYTKEDSKIDSLLTLGFDAVNIVRASAYRYDINCVKKISWKLLKFKLLNRPLVLSYKFISKYFIKPETDKRDNVFPTLIPNWDHTPRSGKHGSVFHNATPQLFKNHVIKALEATKDKENNIIFVKSWNEWGEGNYMEPDIKYGKGYIKALASSLKQLENHEDNN